MTGLVPEIDPDRGILRTSRSGLQALRATPGAADANPALARPLAVLRRPTSRFVTRTWRSGSRTTVEGFIGPDGIVVVPVGADADSIVDIRVAARPSALARVLAGVLDLPPAAHTGAQVPAEPMSWADILAPAQSGSLGWARGLADDHYPIAVHDLRWAARAVDDPTSVLVVAAAGPTLVEVRPAGEADHFTLVVRHPVEIWTALCRLASSAASSARR